MMTTMRGVKIMRRPIVLIAVGLVCCPALPAIAQEGAPSATIQPERGAEVLGTVVRGNTTIIFQAAGPHGLDLNMLRTWSQFAGEHPKIETALAYKPSLMNDPGYLTKHPELATFFQTHPDIKNAIEENPGNFAAIPPRPGE